MPSGIAVASASASTGSRASSAPSGSSRLLAWRASLPTSLSQEESFRLGSAEDRASVDLHILGPLELEAGHEPLSFAGEKGGALLALLLLNANRVVSIEQLIDKLWGDDPPASGAKAVQVRVSQLRKTYHRCGRRRADRDASAGVHDRARSRPARSAPLNALCPRVTARSRTEMRRELPISLRHALGLWRGTPSWPSSRPLPSLERRVAGSRSCA